MGEVWFAAQPRCPLHADPVSGEGGQMRYDPVMSRWTCAGFDGGRCGHVVTDEDIEWQSLGAVRDEQWQKPFRATARPPG
jgi:hypothetical protein